MTAAILLAEAASGFDLVNLIVGTVIGAILSAISCYALLRRTPPLPEEIAKKYVSNEAFDAQKSDRDEQIKALTKRVVELESRVNNLLGDHERALGLIEGEMKGIKESLDQMNRSVGNALETALEALKAAIEAKAGHRPGPPSE